jgi:hypothetical protein
MAAYAAEHDCPINKDKVRRFLSGHGWPEGLQQTAIDSFMVFPIRYFVIDDSGSMNTTDGHRLLPGVNKMVNSTRWGELIDGVRFHAGLAEAAGSPIEFRFLNELNPITVGTNGGADITSEGYQHLMRVLEYKSPSGHTPLCRQIDGIVTQLRGLEHALRSRGHKAVIIVATDGESTDGDIAAALKPLEDLPCWVVIRICTDEDKIVDYWNNIDSKLELDMDVLDDLKGEAAEIWEGGNTWVTYAEPLHRLREFGCQLREFDLIDESKLNVEQMLAIVGAM